MGVSNDFAKTRAQIVAEYEKKLRDLDILEGAHAVAVELVAVWVKDRPDRSTHLYVWPGGLHVGFGLGKGESFGDAEETFCQAQERLAAAVNEDGTREVKWADVGDESTNYKAARGSRGVLRPVDDEWGWIAGMSVEVFAPEGAGAACRLVQVGTKTETHRVEQSRQVPVYRAFCPGDPAPLAGEAA